ncbi:MAG: sigma-54-dependent Fis family transcriptional regulator [Candidatus Tectomicrobia bacterium]|uniref:Sigma-54-dependent Fis family transcriptional regulator n=1 Tax=Tectimicrobiota bacterium TaxID=2528274 RepID=A0A933GKV5_UNCTE|nr:sigma-54-dependent Fis family transcriptional regulator [Candidatus Tectomicrobia bacterium]
MTQQPIHILVVDDEDPIRHAISNFLKEENYLLDEASDGPQALEKLQVANYHIVITDLNMPGLTGLELLRKIKEEQPYIQVVLITGYGSITSAVEAMKFGAADYITKPFDLDEILRVVQGLAAKVVLNGLRHKQEGEELQKRPSYGAMIGKSLPMQQVYQLIDKVANTNATILITGESGTGKELVAKAIHLNSRRRDKRFVTINCADLPEGLLENELFGHIKGAYTGAYQNQKGLFEIANGGTVFLDEIGDISSHIQSRLLRVLQEHEFRPIGGTQYIKVDVRIIAATNKELAKLVAQGVFREDLYFRLQVVPIHLPLLRERADDLPLLIKHFFDSTSEGLNKPLKGISEGVLNVLNRYPWPGNIRELENAVKYMRIMCGGERIQVNDLPSHIQKWVKDSEREDFVELSFSEAKNKFLTHFEQDLIRRYLELTEGNVSKAAKMLKIERANLLRIMRKHQIASKDFRPTLN